MVEVANVHLPGGSQALGLQLACWLILFHIGECLVILINNFNDVEVIHLLSAGAGFQVVIQPEPVLLALRIIL